MRYAFAGDRDISVEILSFLISNGHKPVALLVTDNSKASHADELIRVSDLGKDYILEGNQFKEADNILALKMLNLDYIIGIHFPYLIPKAVLEVPKIGFLNLHPAYLPYNKGWHTPSWAIMEGTPYGATLHFMSEDLDNGDIIHQKECYVLPSDTANTLYKRVKQLEVDVFKEALPALVSLSPPRKKQEEKGTSHLRKHLASLQRIDIKKTVVVKDFIDQLRGLTTNKLDEAAYFEQDGKRYYMQINIVEEERN